MFPDPVQVPAVVFLAEDARLAIMAALYDVKRQAIEIDTRSAGHARILD